MLNNRTIEIIKDLIDYDEINAKQLAEKFNTTTRTIYYDLNNIQCFLKVNGLRSLSKNKEKFFLNFNAQEKTRLIQIINNNKIYSSRDRRDYLAIKLFYKKIIILNNEAEVFGVLSIPW